VASTTPINNLRKPDQTDAPLGGVQISNLADDIDTKLIPRFANIAARNQAIPTPVQGMVCHIDEQTNPALPSRLMVFSRNSWRLVGPSPLPAIDAVGNLVAAGTFNISPQAMGNAVVSDPGFPYRLSVNVILELGSTTAGSRWDLSVRVDGTTSGLFDYNVSTIEALNAQRIDSPIVDAVFTGTTTVYLEARRAYGTGSGTVSSFNRRFQIARHAA
jgi:hypothetical protein